MTRYLDAPEALAPAPQNGRRPSREERKLANERAKVARLKLQQDAGQERAFASEEWRTEQARIREDARRQRDAARSLRRADQWAKAKVVLHRLQQTFVLVGAIVGVNLVAVAGQVTAFHEGFAWTLLLSVAAAGVVESIAIYVGWHAHIALIEGDSVFRLRAASYLIAVVVGGLNYHHYAPDWIPTDKAVMFGLASLLSPWLWAIHSRHVHRRQLRTAGLIDPRAPKFSALRWLLHRRETWEALRWAVRYGEQSPASAITAVQMEHSRAVENASLAAARAEMKASWELIAASQSAALDVAANHNADLEDLIAEGASRNTPAITSPCAEVMEHPVIDRPGVWLDDSEATETATVEPAPALAAPLPVTPLRLVLLTAPAEPAPRPTPDSGDTAAAKLETLDWSGRRGRGWSRPESPTWPQPVATEDQSRDRKKPTEQDRRKAVNHWVKQAKAGRVLSKPDLATWAGWSETWAYDRICEGRVQMAKQGWTFDSSGRPNRPKAGRVLVANGSRGETS